jgi:hypothetical protein
LQSVIKEIFVKRFLVVAPIFLFMLGACNAFGPQADPNAGASVAQTQTAAAPPTAAGTPVPKVAVIVNAFNGALRGADPLEETLDAKFSVTDIGFDISGDPPAITTLRVHVECECLKTKSSCSTERAFVAVAHVFEKDGVRKKILEQIPKTVQVMQVRAFDRMQPIGIIEVSWQDLLAFANGEITGEQLGARIIRLTP